MDDNATNRGILREQLANSELGCETASDGQQALTMLREAAAAKTPFGLAILDRKMPGMDGEQLAQAIKGDPDISDTALMLLTSSGECDPQRLRSVGFAGWMNKPVRQSQLLQTIAETIACAAADPTRGPARMEDGASSSKVNRIARRKKARILLVEDHEISLEAGVALLTRAGYECDTADDGRKAVEAVLRNAYDVVLMDCQLPEMGGVEATRRIRQHETAGELSREDGRRIPIVALTASAIKGDRERCLEAGMDDYLIKPLNMTRLVEVIESYLTRSEEESEHTSVAAFAASESSSANGNPAAPFDREGLRKRWGPDETLIEGLITKFQNRAGADLALIEENVAVGDAEKTASSAHALKGSAAYLEAKRVCEIAGRLEQMGRDGDLSNADTYLAELRDEVKRCIDYEQNTLMPVTEN